jgi:hypothetical protein
MRRLLALATLTLTSLAACESGAPTTSPLLKVADDSVALEVGFVDGPFRIPEGMDPRSLWMDWPKTVNAGESFTMKVRTVGSRCRDVAITDLQLANAGNTVIVTPHDGLQVAEMCPDDLVFLEREVTLQFDTPGTATIVLRGRYFYEGQSAEQVVTVEVR